MKFDIDDEAIKRLMEGEESIGRRVRELAAALPWRGLNEESQTAREETISAAAAALLVKAMKEDEGMGQDMLMLKGASMLVVKLYSEVIRAETEIARLSHDAETPGGYL